MPDGERIRGYLDLGDSAPAAKKLNEEIERLIADLKKVTEQFSAGKMAPADFAAANTKLRGEISGLNGSLEQLKPEEKSSGMDKLTRGLFGLERATSSIISGTGLGRAAGILEGVIGMVGGPAGLGFGIGLLANTIDNVAPKIYAGFQKMWTGIDPEKTAEIKKQLEEVAAAYRTFVEQLEARAKPGSEEEQGFIQSRLARMFNMKTLKGAGGLENQLLSAALRHEVSDMKRQEIEDLGKLQTEQSRLEEGIKSQTAMGIRGRPDLMRADLAKVNDQIQAIEQTAASRTRDKLLKNASNPNTPEGQEALKQLKSLAMKHPEWGGDLVGHIDQILNAGAEEKFFNNIPTQSAGLSDEEKQLAMEIDQAELDRGPARRSRREQLEKRIAEAQGFKEEEEPRYRSRHRQVTGPLPRSTFGTQFTTQASADAANLGAEIDQQTIPGFKGQDIRDRTRHDQERRKRLQDTFNNRMENPNVRRGMIANSKDPAITAERKYQQAVQDLNDLKSMQARALGTQQQGLVTNEKTQRTVSMIQAQIQHVTNRLAVLDREANKQLQQQQRTMQNNGVDR